MNMPDIGYQFEFQSANSFQSLCHVNLIELWQEPRKQECIPVGCVPTAAVASVFTGGGVVSARPPGQTPPSGQTTHTTSPLYLPLPPVNRQMPVKTIPSPILRVCSVIIHSLPSSTGIFFNPEISKREFTPLFLETRKLTLYEFLLIFATVFTSIKAGSREQSVPHCTWNFNTAFLS